jgi:hypothetical protein
MTKAALTTALLATTALALPLSHAWAQTTPADTSAPVATAPAPAKGSPAATQRTTQEDVVVYAARRGQEGGGLIKPQVVSKSVSTVSSAYIRTQPAIENAYQYVQLTPGALVTTTDPYGLSEQFSINVHGLGQDELGYVLEGMPLNDIGYYTAYPSQFVDSENIDEVSLAQGSADLDSPVISATGGLMTLTILDPSVRPGGVVDLSVGSYDTNRAYLRLDSGLIGDTGLRAFASYSFTHAHDWHGPGYTKRQHSDFKVVKEWDNGSRFTMSGTYHDGITPTYVEPTLSNFQQYGAKGAANNYDGNFTPGDTNYYALHIGTFRIMYVTAPSKIVLNDTFSVNVTPYWQYGYGNSPYGADLTETGNFQGADGGPTGQGYTVNIPNYAATGGTVMANFQDLQYREGVDTKLNVKTGNNTFVVGFWLDHSDETDTQTYSALSPAGLPADIWAEQPSEFIRLPNGEPLVAGADRVLTTIFEPFVGDILKLFDNRLTLEAGFKEAWVWRQGFNEAPGPQKYIDIDNIEPLPRIAARYDLDSHDMLFANISTNFRTASEQTMFDAYYAGYLYGVANSQLKPEYSVSEDVGYRYTGGFGTASVTFFNFDFTNRQVSTIIGSALVNESINAGRQSTYGLDFEAGGKPWYHISPYLSAEWLHSVDDSNLQVGTDYLPTAGKTSIRSPAYQVALGLNYDDGTFFANFNVKTVGSQYSTFMNDEKIPGYTVENMGFGVRLPWTAPRARPEIKINLSDLSGVSYLGSVANPTSNAQTQKAVGGSTIAGSSPTYYLSGGFAAMMTYSQAF